MTTRMTIWNPVRQSTDLFDAVDRMLSEGYGTRGSWRAGTNGDGVIVPPADAWESDDDVVIQLAVPGADRESLDITYDKDSLIVSGRILPREQEKTWVLHERARGAFQRRFSLGTPIDSEHATAGFENGILTLRLPKHPETKPRKISVKAG